MRFYSSLAIVTLVPSLLLLGSLNQAVAQTNSQANFPDSTLIAGASLPDAPEPQSSSSTAGQQESPEEQRKQETQERKESTTTPAGTPKHETPKPLPQPKRILGLMPNYRAVSAGVLPPPPTAGQAFKIASQNSFDYSGLVFVGITSLMAEGSESHPQLGKGIPGFWGYYWRGFVDKTDGNYWVIFIMPTIVHEDERYYAKGQGPISHRLLYAASRVLITPNYSGKNTFNAAEIFGRGISQAISLTYYPSGDQAVGPFMEKYGYAVGRDALTNAFREVWPDINEKIIHHRRKRQGILQ